MARQGDTKVKLTLSVGKKYIAMLHRASARRGCSISQLVEELAERLDKERDMADDDAAQPAPGLGTAWVAENKGMLTGKLKKADYERDDMTGYALRKYVRHTESDDGQLGESKAETT